MRQKKTERFYVGGTRLDRTDGFQKFYGSGLDRIQFHWIRTGLGLKNFTVRSSLQGTFCACYMVIDSFQKRFLMNMQLRQCFSRAKPFRLKKSQILPDFVWLFLISKKAKDVQKSQNFKIWPQKTQDGNPVSLRFGSCRYAHFHMG